MLTKLLPARLEIRVKVFTDTRQLLFFLILDYTWREMHFLALDISPNIHELIWYIHFLDYIESFPRCKIMSWVTFIFSTLSSWNVRVHNVISIQLEVLRLCCHLRHMVLWHHRLIQMVLKLQKDTLFDQSLIQLLLIHIGSWMQRCTYTVSLYTIVFSCHIITIMSLFKIYLCNRWIESCLSEGPVFERKSWLSVVSVSIFFIFGFCFIHD
jgi:hypothetical protein